MTTSERLEIPDCVSIFHQLLPPFLSCLFSLLFFAFILPLSPPIPPCFLLLPLCFISLSLFLSAYSFIFLILKNICPPKELMSSCLVLNYPLCFAIDFTIRRNDGISEMFAGCQKSH